MVKWRSRFRLPRFKWPSAPTAIALLALIVSGLQLIFTAPILTQFYIRPDLTVTGSPRPGQKDKISVASYKVANDGNAAATKIEIGFLVDPTQRVALMPAIGANIVEQNQAGLIKFVRIEVERLSAGESFLVTIFPPTASKESAKREKPDSPFKAGWWLFPAFSFVRSAEGPGRYVPAEGEKDFWPGTEKARR